MTISERERAQLRQLELKVYAQAAHAFQSACQRCDISPLLVQPLATKYAEYLKEQSPFLDYQGFVESCLGITTMEVGNVLDSDKTSRGKG